LEGNSITIDQLENIDAVWVSADIAYAAYGINLEEIATNGETNPLSADQIYEFLKTPAGVELLLVDRSSHKPYVLFLEILSDEMDKNLLSDHMQFEANYLEALMDAHPGSLEAAKEVYQENFVEEALKDAAGDMLLEIMNRIRLRGGPIIE
jgi:hypothetical protein